MFVLTESGRIEHMDIRRRDFVFLTCATALCHGCRSVDVFGDPELRFGVVSDIHITTRKSCRALERALRYFKARGVDAVVIPGDLTDWGLKSGLSYLKETWDAAFGNTEVVPLFCTGNHDFEGWVYDDMAMEMRINGYSSAECLAGENLSHAWKDVFGCPLSDVRCRCVKGFDFVSLEFGAKDGSALRHWLLTHEDRVRKGRPFFFFQHLPIVGTTVDSDGWADEGVTKPILADYPNCVAITGHAHRPFIDERQIWQGEFTVVGAPSLSYSCFPPGHENGEGDRSGEARQAMPLIPTRRDLRGGQGFVFNVWSDRIVIERIDLDAGKEAAPAWIVPLQEPRAKPFAEGEREDTEPVPSFPIGARIDLGTRNTENRSGYWIVALDCVFPSARMPVGHRVFDYEIRVVPVEGGRPLVKRFLSPAYARSSEDEPSTQRFWFDAAEIPQCDSYFIEVRARNCFGKSSRPLVAVVRHGKVEQAEMIRGVRRRE